MILGAACLGNSAYRRRHVDVQILNLLIIFVLWMFAVKLVLNILSIISVNI